MNPKTKAVVDAFLDEKTPASLRAGRREWLRRERADLFNALEDLVSSAIEKGAI